MSISFAPNAGGTSADFQIGGVTRATLDNTGKITATSFAGDGSLLTGITTLPTQTSNASKYLTTNGTAASWTSLSQSIQVFTSSGTFTVPTGITSVRVTVVGGGGGQSGAGGTSSFGAHCSATGGGSVSTRTGGTGTGGDINVTGGTGATATSLGGVMHSGSGGSSLLGFGGPFSGAYSAGTGYGAGVGGWAGAGCSPTGGNGAGGGGTAIKFVTGLTPGGTVTVTVGAGGTGTAAGTGGIVVVEWN
jgi:hypothetical protein